MKHIASLLAISFLFIGGCLSRQGGSTQIDYDFTGIDKVAIVTVEGARISEVAKDQISDFFSIELLNKGYAPIGRDQIRAQLKQQNSEAQDLESIENSVDVGVILDVPAVLDIRVAHFGNEMSISAKMINVSDRSTLWLESDSGEAKESRSDIFSFPKRKRGDESLLTNPLAGPPMGPGQNVMPLSPEEVKTAKALIKSMCKSLPRQITSAWE